MTVKELIETLKTCDEKSEVKVEHWNSTVSPIEEVIDYSKELNEVINTTLTCLTGFEVHGQAACVKPENFDLTVGANYARIKAEDKIWEGLGFVLQWAKYGLKK